jgi:membrane protein
VAYYALFALIPVLSLSIAFASFFLGQAVRGDVEDALADLVGDDFASALLSAIDSVDLGGSEATFSLISFGILIFTATLLFVAWKEVVDLLWGIPRERGARASVMRRLFGLAALLGSGALLTLNLAVETIIATVDRFVDNQLLDILLKLMGSFIPVALGALFVGVLFKYTPDLDVSWRSVWFAALVSMAMLSVGAWGYGLYLDRYAFSSAAGAVGALLLGLVFVYYGTAILLYGMTIVKLAHASEGYVPLAFRRLKGTNGA